MSSAPSLVDGVTAGVTGTGAERSFLWVHAKSEYWQPDSKAVSCPGDGCYAQFGVTVRRHHCRACGFVYCDKCASHIHDKEYRLCNECRTCIFEKKTSPLLIKAARSADPTQLAVLLDRGYIDYGEALTALLVAYRSIVIPGSGGNARRGSGGGGGTDGVTKNTLAAVQVLLKYGAVVADRPGLHEFLCYASPVTMNVTPSATTGLVTAPNYYDTISESALKALWSLADKGSMLTWRQEPSAKGVRVESRPEQLVASSEHSGGERKEHPEIIRTNIRVSATPAQVLALLLNPHRRGEYDEQLDSIEIVHTIDEKRRIFLHKMKAAWPVAPRSFVYLSTWKLASGANEPDRYLIANRSVTLESCPQARGTMRAAMPISGFVIRAIAGAGTAAATADGYADTDRTEIQYISQTDMNGALPPSVAKRIRVNDCQLLAGVEAVLNKQFRTVDELTASAAAGSSTATAASASTATASGSTSGDSIKLKPLRPAAIITSGSGAASPRKAGGPGVFDPTRLLPSESMKSYFLHAHGPFSENLVTLYKARAVQMESAAYRESVLRETNHTLKASAVQSASASRTSTAEELRAATTRKAGTGSLVIQRPSMHAPTPLAVLEEPVTPKSPIPPPPPDASPLAGPTAAVAATVHAMGVLPELDLAPPPPPAATTTTAKPAVAAAGHHHASASSNASIDMSFASGDLSALNISARLAAASTAAAGSRAPASSVAGAGGDTAAAGVGSGVLLLVQEKRVSIIPPPPPPEVDRAASMPPPPPPDSVDVKSAADGSGAAASSRPPSVSNAANLLLLSSAPPQPLHAWTPAQVVAWMNANSLAPSFIEWMKASPANAVDGSLLAEMDDGMLIDAGVTNKIHRVKLLNAIEVLRNERK